MKVIPKLQKGGPFDSLFTLFTANEQKEPKQNAPSKSPEEKKSEEKGKLTEEKFFDMIKDIDGLPNEMDAVISNLINTFTVSKLIGEDTDSIATMYLQNLYQIKRLAQNKKSYDDAIKNVSKMGSAGEPAITLDGKLVTQNKSNGKLENVNLDEYFEDPENYYLISNSQLANLRAYSPSMNSNFEAIDILNNSIGFEGFQDLIDKAAINLGSSSYSNSGLFQFQNKAVVGLKVLNKLSKEDKKKIYNSYVGDGVYKYTGAGEDNIQDINYLIDYLQTVIPNRAKVWASIKLGTSDKEEATRRIITSYLLTGRKTSKTFNVDVRGKLDSEKEENSKKENDPLKNIKLNVAAQLLKGIGNQEDFMINVGTNEYRLVHSITRPLVKMNGDNLGVNSTLQEASQGQFGSILDLNNVSMGMSIISPSLFNQIILGDAKISSIDYPCIIQDDGSIVPDLSQETAQKRQNAYKILKQKGININDPKSIKNNYQIINKVYQDLELQPAYDSNGNINNKFWTRFGVLNAYTDNNVIGAFGNYNLLEKVSNEYISDNIVSILKQKNKDYTDPRGMLNNNNIYKGTVWIPIKSDMITSMSDSLTPEQLKALQEQQMASDQKNKLQLGTNRLKQ